MPDFKTTISVSGQDYETLKDILPDMAIPLDILFIAKTPALQSVEAGHYFQGKQGQMFWNKLKDYNILQTRPNTYEDENLLENNFGITDIVKIPRNFGNEPSDEEYKCGLDRIKAILNKHKPKIIIFVYKKVLDKILNHGFCITQNSKYGFNEDFEKFFQSKVFVFPMPGTPCKKDQIKNAMIELQNNLIR